MSDFGKNLKYFRLKDGLTQSELAKAIGISTSAIGMYEQERREPDFETLEKIADYFNVSIGTLMGSEEEHHWLLTDTENEFVISVMKLNHDNYKRLEAYMKALLEQQELETRAGMDPFRTSDGKIKLK